MKVSVLLLTFNEAANLPRCLAALAWCDDIVTVDSGSTDGTLEIARAAGVRVLSRPFDDFATQRNFGLDHGDLRNEWVLHLDADEVVTEAFRARLEALEPPAGVDAYRVPSKLMLNGRWLRRAGMYPAYQVRLGHRERLRFVQVGHGQREDLPPGRVGTFDEPYLHYNFSHGLPAWLRKHVRYAEDRARSIMFVRAAGAAEPTRWPEKRVLPVSVVVPVKNEERNLTSCLERLSAFAEVIVVDSASTDRTVAIAEAAGARVVQFVWNGRYPKKRNHVLMTERLAAPWVLFLDADEYVTDAFVDELARTLADTPHAGFWLNYTNYFMGRELKHGVPQRKLALFRVGSALYERIDEEGWSGLDMEVHEHPVVEGTVGEIAARIDHRDFRGMEKFTLRHLDYAKWEAERYRALHAAGSEAARHLTARQRFKYMHLGKWWYFLFYFVFTYIAKRGFLDGRAGFNYAFFKAWYFRLIATLIAEAERKASAGR